MFSIKGLFNRKIIILTNEELIIKKFLFIYKIKISNIKSCYIVNNNSLRILTNNNKLIKKLFPSSSKIEAEILVSNINKEPILYGDNSHTFSRYAIAFNFFLIFSHSFSKIYNLTYVLCLFMILSIILLYKNYSKTVFLLNINSNLISIYKKGSLINTVNFNNCSYGKNINDCYKKYTYQNKYNIYLDSNATFPIQHAFALKLHEKKNTLN